MGVSKTVIFTVKETIKISSLLGALICSTCPGNSSVEGLRRTKSKFFFSKNSSELSNPKVYRVFPSLVASILGYLFN